MSYIEESLSSGENIEGIFKFHWFVRIPLALWIILGIPTLGLTLLLALYEYLRLKYTEQGITNKRIILKTGIISRKSQEIKLKAIETVEIDQGILGRIFGFGSIKVTGQGISDLIFKNVADPMSVKRQIESVSIPTE